MVATKSKTNDQSLSTANLMIILVLITLILVGVSAFAAKNLFTTIRRDTKVLNAKNKADKQLQANIDAAPGLVSSFQSLGPQATILADALPNTSDLPSLIVALENMAGGTGLKLKTVAPGLGSAISTTPPKPVDAFTPAPKPYPYSITFDGSYVTLQRFLATLENSARPMRVVGMQVSGTGNALSGEIDVQTYYQEKASLPFGTEVIK